jgi:hypothetical protein
MEYARMMSAGELPAARALLERVGGERGRSAAGPAGGDDGLARKVLAYIRELGFAPAIVREGGVFGFDFAITDPATGLYAIGIECDAPRHRLLQRARAREIWRPSVLKRALPSLHRVSSRAWYHEPETEKMRLKAAIEAALGRDKEVKT